MTKFKEIFNLMLASHKKEFEAFQKIHDAYASDPDNLQEKYNSEGEKIQKIVKHYEDVLCGHSEGSGYGSFSGKLAEKFQNEVRKKFPLIDHIGIKVFNIKKISPQSG